MFAFVFAPKSQSERQKELQGDWGAGVADGFLILAEVKSNRVWRGISSHGKNRGSHGGLALRFKGTECCRPLAGSCWMWLAVETVKQMFALTRRWAASPPSAAAPCACLHLQQWWWSRHWPPEPRTQQRSSRMASVLLPDPSDAVERLSRPGLKTLQPLVGQLLPRLISEGLAEVWSRFADFPPIPRGCSFNHSGPARLAPPLSSV